MDKPDYSHFTDLINILKKREKDKKNKVASKLIGFKPICSVPHCRASFERLSAFYAHAKRSHPTLIGLSKVNDNLDVDVPTEEDMNIDHHIHETIDFDDGDGHPIDPSPEIDDDNENSSHDNESYYPSDEETVTISEIGSIREEEDDTSGIILDDNTFGQAKVYTNSLLAQVERVGKGIVYPYLDQINKVRFRHNLTDTALEDILATVFSIFTVCQDKNLSFEETKHVVDTCKRFQKTETLDKYIMSKATYIAPKKRVIEKEGVKPFKYHYTSVVDICRLALTNQHLVNSITEETTMPDHVLLRREDLVGSQHRREKMKGSLRLQLSADDCTVTNTAGHSRTGKNLFLYLSIMNVPYKHRAKRLCVFNPMIINRFELKQSNMSVADVFNDKLIPDLLRLSHGIKVETNNNNVTIPVSLHSIVGDNLGLSELLGISSRFVVNQFICRICGLQGWNQSLTTTNQLLCDQAIDYKQALAEDVPKNRIKDMKYGLRAPCPFVAIPGLSIWEITGVDPLHDLLEGCLETVIEAVLSMANLGNSWINFQLKRIKFKHGRVLVTSNRNDVASVRIQGSALQKAEFLSKVEMVLVEHDRYDENTTACQLFRAFKGIVVLSRRFNIDVAELERRIEVFTEIIGRLAKPKMMNIKDAATGTVSRKTVEVPFKITPKMHFLQHYPRMATTFSQLPLTDSLVYERVHQTFKNLVKLNKNYINISYTMTRRHSLCLALELSQSDLLKANFWRSPPSSSLLAREGIVGEVVCETEVVPTDVTRLVEQGDKPKYILIDRRIVVRNECEEVWVGGKVFELDGSVQWKGLPKLNVVDYKYCHEDHLCHRDDFIFSKDNESYLIEGV